jgi:hypothetical protein
MAAPFRNRVSFTVPAGAGSYAPERLTFGPASTGIATPSLLGISVLIETPLIASAVVELWLLKLDADPSADASYFLYKTVSANGDTLPLASVGGAQIRVKSGGTAGSQPVNAWSDSGRY